MEGVRGDAALYPSRRGWALRPGLPSVLRELVGEVVDFFLDTFRSASNESQVRVEFAQLIPEMLLLRVEAQQFPCSPFRFPKDFKVLFHKDAKHMSAR